MTISEAQKKIDEALANGIIDRAKAEEAARAIREKSLYGNRMTARDRAKILELRYGI
jgi:hypothetical protein